MTSQASAEDVIRDPHYLLHRVDPVRRELQFRQTSAEALRNAAFIDGRTDIWTGPPIAVSFDAATGMTSAPGEPFRTIFHMSFCGSTLLARLLDTPGKALSLKEPNCLVDLGAWKTASHQLPAAAGAEFGLVLRFSIAMLGRRWTAGEEIVVKPPGWANNLIDDLLAQSEQTRAVFLTIGRERFLEAVLRGGTDRLAFTARLAAHLSTFVKDGAEHVQAAIQSTADPIAKIAKMALVAHHLQLRLFERAIGSGRFAAAEVIDFAELEAKPAAVASRAAEVLQLRVLESDVSANVEKWTSSNAKADASFSADQRRSEDEQVRAAYGALIDDALEWGAAALGPATLQLP